MRRNRCESRARTRSVLSRRLRGLAHPCGGAGGAGPRTRTGTPLRADDFESSVSAIPSRPASADIVQRGRCSASSFSRVVPTQTALDTPRGGPSCLCSVVLVNRGETRRSRRPDALRAAAFRLPPDTMAGATGPAQTVRLVPSELLDHELVRATLRTRVLTNLAPGILRRQRVRAPLGHPLASMQIRHSQALLLPRFRGRGGQFGMHAQVSFVELPHVRIDLCAKLLRFVDQLVERVALRSQLFQGLFRHRQTITSGIIATFLSSVRREDSSTWRRLKRCN